MRWLFWILFILTIAVGISMLANSNHGYVLIIRPPYRFELSLNFLLVIIAFSFIFLHFVLRIAQYIKHLPASVKTYKEHQRIKTRHNALIEALNALVEGHYQLSEKAAVKSMELSDDVALSALIAARASHKMNQKNQREYYFAEAERMAPTMILGRLLMQAESLLDDRQYTGVINTLQKLEKIEPNHPPALRLLLKAQVQLKQWEQVLTTLEKLEKKAAVEFWYAKEIRQKAHSALIERHLHQLPELISYWKKLSTEEQLNPVIVLTAAKALIKSNGGEQAAEIIGKCLTKRWDSELVSLFGDCITANPQKLLQQAEIWLISHQNDANLLLSLGNMCLHLHLWGKAQNYLEASISLYPNPIAHAKLAKLFEQLEEFDKAQQHYKSSTELFIADQAT